MIQNSHTMYSHTQHKVQYMSQHMAVLVHVSTATSSLVHVHASTAYTSISETLNFVIPHSAVSLGRS